MDVRGIFLRTLKRERGERTSRTVTLVWTRDQAQMVRASWLDAISSSSGDIRHDSQRAIAT